MVITTLVITLTGPIQGSDCSPPLIDCCDTCVPEPCCNPCGGFFLEAQMLYLRAFEGGLSSPCDRTQIINTIEDGILTSRLTGKSHDPNFDWNFGFRVGMGRECANSVSDIAVYWTYYNSHTGRKACERRWNIHFNVVDVLWEYPWSISCGSDSALILFCGVRCANINQKLRTNFISTVDGIAITSKGKAREKFLGIGPLFGIEGDFGIGCGFGVFGNAGVGISYGRFHVKSDHTSTSSTGINIDHLKKHVDACQPVVDLGVGVYWETCFCNCKTLILELELEHHRYFNHNQFCGYGDLSLDGISFGVGILY